MPCMFSTFFFSLSLHNRMYGGVALSNININRVQLNFSFNFIFYPILGRNCWVVKHGQQYTSKRKREKNAHIHFPGKLRHKQLFSMNFVLEKSYNKQCRYIQLDLEYLFIHVTGKLRKNCHQFNFSERYFSVCFIRIQFEWGANACMYVVEEGLFHRTTIIFCWCCGKYCACDMEWNCW